MTVVIIVITTVYNNNQAPHCPLMTTYPGTALAKYCAGTAGTQVPRYPGRYLPLCLRLLLFLFLDLEQFQVPFIAWDRAGLWSTQPT